MLKICPNCHREFYAEQRIKFCSLKCRYATLTPEVRFWKFVDKRNNDECWPWLGTANYAGRGSFHFEGKMQVAPRVAWRLIHGENVPGSLKVLHTCDNPACVNPDHLFLGTQKDNAQDMLAKGREARGERSGVSKLTQDEVDLIRRLHQKKRRGYGCVVLGRQFGVSSQNVLEIIRGNIWSK